MPTPDWRLTLPVTRTGDNCTATAACNEFTTNVQIKAK
jgi:hypothetical protein